MNIDGITIKKEDGYVVCYIENFSDELKDLIRKDLKVICRGKILTDEDNIFYSYENTLNVFLDRYNDKEEIKRKGMLGEFIAHLIIDKFIDHLQKISIFFNKEERSFKKGFDLTYIDIEKKDIWYGEIKSGEINQSPSPEDKNEALLQNAKNDLKSKLSKKRLTLWDSVMIDAGLSFASEEALKIKKLLREDVQELEKDPLIKKNAILISVLFHNTNQKINPDSVKEYLEKINNELIFSDIIIFSIQKSTYKKIEEFLNKEAGN